MSDGVVHVKGCAETRNPDESLTGYTTAGPAICTMNIVAFYLVVSPCSLGESPTFRAVGLART